MEKLVLVLLVYGMIEGSRNPIMSQTSQKVKNPSSNSSLEQPLKIDWVDQELLKLEMLREGIGEHGARVLLNQSDQQAAQKLFQLNGFNALVSDKISLFRAIRDLRITKCKWLKYDQNLPNVSIIIMFYDEHWSTLLRTVHTLVLRTPKRLVKELILVDDFSTKPILKKKLDKYVKENFENVMIIRNKKREGLVKSRRIASKAATGIVLIFVDPHCEVGINWLPPLLQPIKDDYRTVTCPFIDVIDNDDFSMYPEDEGARGAFDWNFDYQRLPRLHEAKHHPEKPFENPIMSGKFFAISKKWFWELGGYDEGLELWGGEQYELSFKIWMCGGRMVDVPCSRIGCVRKKRFFINKYMKGDFITRNYIRIAEVWMDKWKKYLYQRRLDEYSSVKCGNISEAKRQRQILNCKSFDWFMKNIAFDIIKIYPPEEFKDVLNCMFVSRGLTEMCIDTQFATDQVPIKVEKCTSETNITEMSEQKFYFRLGYEIQPGQRSLCFSYKNDDERLILDNCDKQEDNQHWIFNLETYQLMNENKSKCIEVNGTSLELSMKRCSSTLLQQWKLKFGNETTDITQVLNDWKKENDWKEEND